MKRAPLYSGRNRAPKPRTPDDATSNLSAADAAAGEPRAPGRLRGFFRKHQSPLLFVAGLAIAGLAVTAYRAQQPAPREFVQEDIDAAVMHTLENKTLPSKAAKAAEMVRESVVRVTGFVDDPKDSDDAKDSKDPPKDPKDPPKDQKDQKDPKDNKDAKDARDKDPSKALDPDMSKGGEKKGRIATGVVIVENGIILTSLHVVAGAKKIGVTFSDGMETEADIVGVQPENDLAVIRAKKVPDDQPAATLGSSGKLKPGDEVVAVGFPFGIGPSVSAGVVSGTNREFRSPEGSRVLNKLIQFDAAVNPGNSGGPLVTMDGEVVGIVAALLNPTESRTFIGIGFAVTIESAGSAVGIPPF
jgi:S1-C subfamily serine protease